MKSTPPLQAQLQIKWENRAATTYRAQCQFFQQQYPSAELLIQKGYKRARYCAVGTQKNKDCLFVHQVIVTQYEKLKSGICQRQVTNIIFTS